MGDCLVYFWILIYGRRRDNKKLELYPYFQFVFIDYLPKGVQGLIARISGKACWLATPVWCLHNWEKCLQLCTKLFIMKFARLIITLVYMLPLGKYQCLGHEVWVTLKFVKIVSNWCSAVFNWYSTSSIVTRRLQMLLGMSSIASRRLYTMIMASLLHGGTRVLCHTNKLT